MLSEVLIVGGDKLKWPPQWAGLVQFPSGVRAKCRLTHGYLTYYSAFKSKYGKRESELRFEGQEIKKTFREHLESEHAAQPALRNGVKSNN